MGGNEDVEELGSLGICRYFVVLRFIRCDVRWNFFYFIFLIVGV